MSNNTHKCITKNSKAGICERFERGPGVTLPTSNSEGQQLLKRYGFHQQGMNYYMRLGVPASFRQLSKLYGEASPAFG